MGRLRRKLDPDGTLGADRDAARPRLPVHARMKWRGSLRARLMLGAAAMLVVFLAGAGWAVQRAHEESVRAARFARLQSTVYLLLAAAEVDAAGALVMPPSFPEPRLSLPGSGPLREHRQCRAQADVAIAFDGRRRNAADERRGHRAMALRGRERGPRAATSPWPPASRGPAARALCRWCSRCSKTRPGSTARSPCSSARRGRGSVAPLCCCWLRRRCCCAGAWRRSAKPRARSARSSRAIRKRSRAATRPKSPRSPTTSTPSSRRSGFGRRAIARR